MVMKESAAEPVTDMLLALGCESLFLVTFQELTINDGEEACDGVWF